MDAVQGLTILAVAGAWGVFAYTVRRWGPGRARRSVRCPEKNQKARLMVEQREGDFGSLRVVDVTACSLLPDEKVTCGKECLDRM